MVLALDLFFYIKELLAQMDYRRLLDFSGWKKSSFVLSTSLTLLARDRLIFSSKRWSFKTYSLHRVENDFELTTFLSLLANSYSTNTSLSSKTFIGSICDQPFGPEPGRFTERDKKVRNLSRISVANSLASLLSIVSGASRQLENILDHADVNPLCDMSKSSISKSSDPKPVAFVSLEQVSSTAFWKGFCSSWCGFLYKSMPFLEIISLVQIIRSSELIRSSLLNGLGRLFVFNARATCLAGERR